MDRGRERQRGRSALACAGAMERSDPAERERRGWVGVVAAFADTLTHTRRTSRCKTGVGCDHLRRRRTIIGGVERLR